MLTIHSTLLPQVVASLRGGVVKYLTTISGWLGHLYDEGGRSKEAEKLDLLAVEMAKQVLGEEYPMTLRDMANLGVTYKKLGRLKEVEELQLRVLEMRKRILGEVHPDTLTSMLNLAVIYLEQGDIRFLYHTKICSLIFLLSVSALCDSSDNQVRMRRL
jgi:hypothetical protein